MACAGERAKTVVTAPSCFWTLSTNSSDYTEIIKMLKRVRDSLAFALASLMMIQVQSLHAASAVDNQQFVIVFVLANAGSLLPRIRAKLSLKAAISQGLHLL